MQILMRLRVVWTTLGLLLTVPFFFAYQSTHSPAMPIIIAGVLIAAFMFYAPGLRGKLTAAWVAVTVIAIGNVYGQPLHPTESLQNSALTSFMMWCAVMVASHVVPWVIYGRRKA